MGQQYRVVRVDMWDYHFPTGHVFESFTDAQKKADELQRESDRTVMDPTSCYIAMKDDIKGIKS